MEATVTLVSLPIYSSQFIHHTCIVRIIKLKKHGIIKLKKKKIDDYNYLIKLRCQDLYH